MADKLDAITIVVATQRSGSTLLCRDIESLGGMGAPREYFLEILGKNAREGLTERDVVDLIRKGERPDDPGIGAVKLMVNYAPKIDAMITGGPQVNPIRALENITAWAHANFRHVNLVVLKRENPLDQAISRAVARLTDVWHKNEGAEKGTGDKEIAPKALNLAILEALPRVLRENDVIREFARRNAGHCAFIGYETLASDVERSSKIIIEHARANGLTPRKEVAERVLRKIIDDQQSSRIKAGLKQFLERRLDLWQ